MVLAGFWRPETLRDNQVREGFLALQHDFAAQHPVLRGVCRFARNEFVRASKKHSSAFISGVARTA
jgi:hypothetical protein